MDKLLIIVTGLLGSRIVEMASHEFEIVNTYNKNPADLQSTVSHQLDITDRKMAFGLIIEVNPRAEDIRCFICCMDIPMTIQGGFNLGRLRISQMRP